jgi:hypothetical protein
MLAVMEDAPARVSTCWNGLAAIRADPLLPPALRSPVYAASAHGNASALAFRASRSDECFSSECFLLPYDLAHARGTGMQGHNGPGADVFVNPRVIVGYEWKQFVWWKYVTRHWAVRWWIMRMERGAEMPFARMIVGQDHLVWRWAGGDCFPVCAPARLSRMYCAHTCCSGDDIVLVGRLRGAPSLSLSELSRVFVCTCLVISHASKNSLIRIQFGTPSETVPHTAFTLPVLAS